MLHPPLRRNALSVAVLLALSPSAFAIDYVFSSGVYAPGVTAPEPLVAGQVLQINAGSTKYFSGSTLTNQTGRVNWNAETLYLQIGALIDNQSLWDAQGNDTLVNNGGSTSTFLNSGTFRKSAGAGSTTIGGIAFVNSGTIDSQTGTINFAGGNATFNAGSQFIGIGSTTISSNASFNGAFTSSNLSVAGGTATGTAARIGGSMSFSGGVLGGTWEVATGQLVRGVGGSTKYMSAATLVNNGTVQWETGDALYLQNDAGIVNNKLYDIQASTTIVNNGGTLPRFTNSSGGTLRVAAGQTANMGTVAFVNAGTLEANGTLNFGGGNATFNGGTHFIGGGTNLITSNATFAGAIESSNLVLQGGAFTGSAAVVSGNVTFTGGSIAGTWELANAQQLQVKDGGTKYLDAATFTNKGTVQWNTGNALYLQNGASFLNQGTFNFNSSASLVNNGGNLPGFTNTGTLHAASGMSGSIGTLAFVNNGGTLNAEGTLRFDGGNATFNSGTKFVGSGSNVVNSNARFVDDFNSLNLTLANGSFAGGNGSAGSKVVVNGTVDLTGGLLEGTWEIGTDQNFIGLSGGTKYVNGAQITNHGLLSWQTENAWYLQNGAQVDNQQVFEILQSATIANNGGALPTLANNGLMKVAAGKTATISTVRFINNGTLLIDGTVNFNGNNATFNAGSVFTGPGVVAINSNASFNGSLESSNLSLNGGGFVGTNAIVNGLVAWTGGSLQGSWEIGFGQALVASDGGTKFADGVTLVNKGVVAWKTGQALYMQNGALIDNRGAFELQTGTTLVNNGGATSTFDNSGTLRVASNQDANVSTIAFVNSAGLIDVGSAASLNFSGGNATFNAGTRFKGAGVAMVTSNARFNGAFESQNLSLRGGVLNGGAAQLNGSAEFTGGYLQGAWTVGAGSTLNVRDGGTKFLDGVSLTNKGTINWQGSGALYFQNGANFQNAGRIDLQTDSSAVHNGGQVGTFVNTGLITKTAGTGTSTIGNNLGFDNQGIVEVTTGTIRLPDNFTNNGTLKGIGSFASNVLINAGHVAPGSSPGTLTFNGEYRQAATGSFDVELASSSLYDIFLVNGKATLDGTLALTCVMTCALNDGDEFVILDSTGDLSGTFATVTTHNFGNGFRYNVVYDYSADLVKLQVLQAGTLPVPEPETWALLVAGLGMLGFMTRRRRSKA